MASGGPNPGARILAGGASGGMLTAALIAVLYAGWRLAGLPFIPFDVFDWTSRRLPGSVITFGIDTMVRLIRALDLGPTAEAAKTAEQTMAIAGVLVVGVLAGAVIFLAARAWGRERAIVLGAFAGAALGATLLMMSLTAGQTGSTPAWLGGVWVLGAFLAWGVAIGWSYRKLSPELSPEAASVERLNRRQFLVALGGATAVVTVAGALVGNLAGARRRREPEGDVWSATHPLPNAGATLEPAPGTRDEFTSLDDHYRIDISTTPPEIDEADWRLRITGLVERPLALTLDDLRNNYPPIDQFVTLSCISNPVAGDLISTQRWTGVSLRRLLSDWGLRPEATHLKLSAADGFFEFVSLETINADTRVMLTYAWDGVPLRVKHGFPLRIYIPDIHGMKQPKWIESIEAVDHWEPGYWVERGWDREARMKATAVIDSVAVDMMIVEADEQTLIPIGGIAHAGARGISRVEVRMDDGDWEEAGLREPLSELTWVVWRYDWRFQPGSHTLTVRCHDGSGTLQIAEESRPHPDGASGFHSQSVRL